MENKKISLKYISILFSVFLLSIFTGSALADEGSRGDQCGGYGMAPDFLRVGARHDHSGPGAFLRRDGTR